MYRLHNIRNVFLVLHTLYALLPHPIVCGVGSALKFKNENQQHSPDSSKPSIQKNYEDSIYDSEVWRENNWPQEVVMKLPSSLHKFLKLHDASDTGGLRGFHHPTKSLLRHYLLSKPHSYPVAGKFQKTDSSGLLARALTGSVGTEENGNWIKTQSDGVGPTSTDSLNPHIGTGALANLEKFLHRVRNNLRTLHDEKQEEGDEVGATVDSLK